jgi:isoleucyl-tRNA synthetase
VSDRITLTLEASAEVVAAVRTHQDFVASETLATTVSYGDAGADAFAGEAGEGETIRVRVARV